MNPIIKTALLMFFFTLCASAMVVTYQKSTRTPAPLPHELYTVVNQQLASFRADDFPGAYRYAASGVQQKFTLPQFENMMRRDYSDITRTQRVEFGFMKVQGATAVVQVFFTAESGSVRSFLFSMIAEGKSWKINGMQELRAFRNHEYLNGTSV